MFKLKPLSKDTIPRALEKATHYRLLNESKEAESICRDVLASDPANQEALITLILSLTDQFGESTARGVMEPHKLLEGLKGEYERAYYAGVVDERLGKAALTRSDPGAGYVAYEYITKAMGSYERAERLAPLGNADSILRWNTCARIIMENNLREREPDDFSPMLE